MYIERRKAGKGVKYYLVHSYRSKGSVRKLRKYLGHNLPKKDLEQAGREAKKRILGLLEELNTKVFSFMLTRKKSSLSIAQLLSPLGLFIGPPDITAQFRYLPSEVG